MYQENNQTKYELKGGMYISPPCSLSGGGSLLMDILSPPRHPVNTVGDLYMPPPTSCLSFLIGSSNYVNLIKNEVFFSVSKNIWISEYFHEKNLQAFLLITF